MRCSGVQQSPHTRSSRTIILSESRLSFVAVGVKILLLTCQTQIHSGGKALMFASVSDRTSKLSALIWVDFFAKLLVAETICIIAAQACLSRW